MFSFHRPPDTKTKNTEKATTRGTPTTKNRETTILGTNTTTSENRRTTTEHITRVTRKKTTTTNENTQTSDNSPRTSLRMLGVTDDRVLGSTRMSRELVTTATGITRSGGTGRTNPRARIKEMEFVVRIFRVS